MGNNPHSIIKKAAVYMGGVTGIDSAGELDIAELSTGTCDPAADTIAFNDATDSKSYEVSLATLMASQCGKGIAYSAGDFVLDCDDARPAKKVEDVLEAR